MFKTSFAPLRAPNEGALIITVASGQKLGTEGVKLDGKLGHVLSRAMHGGHFTGAKEQTLSVLAPAKSKLERIILVGIGDPAKADRTVMQRVGGVALAALGNNKENQAAYLCDQHKGLATDNGEAAAQMAYGARLRSYRFDKYHTKLKPEQQSALRNLTVLTTDVSGARGLHARLDKVADGVFFTRDLVSEPPNVIYPESLAAQCNSLKKLGVKVDVLNEQQMRKLGMGALLGVNQGSVRAPRLVTMSWMGDPKAKDKRPAALVGKGVTFDTGGISIKPAAGMEDMKWDMAGAGAVIGAMMAIAGRKAKANVVGVVGLVENMPDGGAQRPGDVVTTMSGQTVEVINTDAEGRLVLADAVWYTQEKFNPRCVVNLATLTGAIIIALGHEYAGLFSNDDKLSEQLTDAGKAVEENLWRFPLGDAYDKDINSMIADMKNVGAGREAGSIAGAQFVQRFIKKGVAWAHLDIAGVAWSNKDKPMCPKGATAFGVRLLCKFVADVFEK